MRFVFVIFTVLAIPVFAHAATLKVPSQYQKIQDAIDAAVHGDIVLVSPGSYLENINFKGKAITVISSTGPTSTVIDGGQSGSVVTFDSGEAAESFLDGFTVTNGTGTLVPGSTYTKGGGLFCRNASPTVQNNIITANLPDTSGGIYSEYGSLNIVNNVIHNNNVIGGGAAIHLQNSPWTWIIDTIIEENVAGDLCGGILSVDSSMGLRRTILKNNQAKYAGAIYCSGAGSVVTIDACVISGNDATETAGGIWITKQCTASIRGSTIFGNHASGYGGGMAVYDGAGVNVVNSILWNNKAWIGDEVDLDFVASLIVGYSDLEGGKNSINIGPGSSLFFGPQMLDADPRFKNPVNDDFHLTWLSPCINRGLNPVSKTYDLDGEFRPFMGIMDMGADEFTGTHPLAADLFEISRTTGSKVNLQLSASSVNGGRNYVILGSISGTIPGLPLPGGKATLPLNWDVFTSMAWNNLNTPVFNGFAGILDPSGSSLAVFDTLGPFTGGVNLSLYFAYALNNPWDFVSNPVGIEIVP